jgi:hypothetical protein
MTKHLQYSVCLVSFGFLLCLLVLADHYHFWSPKMAVESLSVDFGDVSATDDVRQEIAVKNTGWSALTLERVQPSCSSCIVIHSYTKEPIPSGKQGIIDFSLNISQMKDSVTTSFIIVSNAKPQSAAVVRVTANILTEEQ